MSAVEACCTKAHVGAGSLGLWLQHVSDNTRSNLGWLVVLFLAIPCFKLSNALFQFVYLRQQHRLNLLGRYCALLGGDNYSLEFKHLGLFLDRPAYVKERLRQIERSLEASKKR